MIPLKYRRGGEAPVRALIEEIPNGGCLLVFNAKHRNWRSKAADTGVLQCIKLSDQVIGRADNVTVCDLMITWRET